MNIRDVPIASTIETHSVPLPLTDMLRLRCGGRWTESDDDVVAPTNTTVPQCRLEVRPGAIPRSAAIRQLYGRQEIRVTVRRGDTTLGDHLWHLDPSDTDRRFPLRIGLDSIGDNDEILVEASIAATPPAVHYRPTLVQADTKAAEATPMNDGYDFRGRIRPRGTFGFDFDARIYITVPITPLVARFPQATHRLSSSSQFTGGGLLPPRAGLFFVVEPWDYDRRRNSLHPLPLRFVVGGYLLETSERVFAPTFDFGLSVAFPLLKQDSQLNTALTLTGLVEYDSIDETWGFVLAASAELFSFLGGSSGTNETTPSDAESD